MSFVDGAFAGERRSADARGESIEIQQDFDVVVAGGSTAALAAAFAAAESGARTALLEPTDWIGGQLTASGVPAIDEAWHRITDPQTGEVLLDVSRIARKPANMTPRFLEMVSAVGAAERGWVSRFCFQPRDLLEKHLEPWERRLADRLVVFRNTVVKQVQADPETGRICSVQAIQRTAIDGTDGYDRFLSEDLADWYSPQDSPRFAKTTLRFGEKSTIFIDATEWGEVLVLADAPFLQGVDGLEGPDPANDVCGQATVFCFVQEIVSPEEAAQRDGGSPPDPLPPHLGFGMYEDRPDAWNRIWTYRRIKGTNKLASLGDLSLQNWEYSREKGTGGNDYPFGYLFKSRQAMLAERDDWQGGIDLQVLAATERQAVGWHFWFREHRPPELSKFDVVLAPEVLGTGHGLAKMPYIRDTRRSLGLDGFVLRVSDFLADQPGAKTGRVFADRIALGAYVADVHPIMNCECHGAGKDANRTLPFYLPFRALTNDRYGNLLVAGKTMAQTFLANSATRLHPIEWSSGTAAGVVAAWMSQNESTTSDAWKRISEIKPLVTQFTPTDWQVE